MPWPPSRRIHPRPKAKAPATDHCWVDLSQEHPTEGRFQVLGQRPLVEVNRARAQPRTLGYPHGGIRPEWHFASVGIRPFPTDHERLLDCEPVDSLGLTRERVLRETPPAIGVEVTRRVPSRRVPKSARSLHCLHQATHRARRGTSGRTVRAPMYSAIADSGMRM
jgi:hypothetical protein